MQTHHHVRQSPYIWAIQSKTYLIYNVFGPCAERGIKRCQTKPIDSLQLWRFLPMILLPETNITAKRSMNIGPGPQKGHFIFQSSTNFHLDLLKMLKKNPNIFSQMVVWWYLTMVHSVKTYLAHIQVHGQDVGSREGRFWLYPCLLFHPTSSCQTWKHPLVWLSFFRNSQGLIKHDEHRCLFIGLWVTIPQGKNGTCLHVHIPS